MTVVYEHGERRPWRYVYGSVTINGARFKHFWSATEDVAAAVTMIALIEVENPTWADLPLQPGDPSPPAAAQDDEPSPHPSQFRDTP